MRVRVVRPRVRVTVRERVRERERVRGEGGGWRVRGRVRGRVGLDRESDDPERSVGVRHVVERVIQAGGELFTAGHARAPEISGSSRRKARRKDRPLAPARPLGRAPWWVGEPPL